MKWISGIIDRLLAVLGALILSQAPLYMLQYEHRLAGHVNELQLLTNKFDQAAHQAGKSLPEYEQYFLQHSDEMIAGQGQIIHNVLERKKSFESSYRVLKETHIWNRPFVFLYQLNLPIAKETLASFQPGILINPEGFFYALIGMGLGFLVFSTIHRSLSLIFQKFSRKRTV